MSNFTAGKFAPIPPTIFDANSDKLPILGQQVPSALVTFYYRLTILERDIENLRRSSSDLWRMMEKNAVRAIASRFAATLAPGERALNALCLLVDDWEAIDAEAWRALHEAVVDRPLVGTLRSQLTLMVTKAAAL